MKEMQKIGPVAQYADILLALVLISAPWCIVFIRINKYIKNNILDEFF